MYMYTSTTLHTYAGSETCTHGSLTTCTVGNCVCCVFCTTVAENTHFDTFCKKLTQNVECEQ